MNDGDHTFTHGRTWLSLSVGPPSHHTQQSHSPTRQSIVLHTHASAGVWFLSVRRHQNTHGTPATAGENEKGEDPATERSPGPQRQRHGGGGPVCGVRWPLPTRRRDHTAPHSTNPPLPRPLLGAGGEGRGGRLPRRASPLERQRGDGGGFDAPPVPCWHVGAQWPAWGWPEAAWTCSLLFWLSLWFFLGVCDHSLSLCCVLSPLFFLPRCGATSNKSRALWGAAAPEKSCSVVPCSLSCSAAWCLWSPCANPRGDDTHTPPPKKEEARTSHAWWPQGNSDAARYGWPTLCLALLPHTRRRDVCGCVLCVTSPFSPSRCQALYALAPGGSLLWCAMGHRRFRCSGITRDGAAFVAGWCL